jgi:hypothetical protein
MRVMQLVALSAAATAVTGGIALAAVNSAGRPADPGHVLPTTAASQAQQHAGPVLAAHPTHGKSNGADKTHPTPQGSPHPSLDGLCHAWLAGAGRVHGKARSNPAFSYLINTSGGSESVTAYCTARLAERPQPSDEASDSDEPSVPEHPNKHAHPNRSQHLGNTSHPTGRH